LDFFNSKGVTVDIHQISGSVEIAPNIGLADAIVDIVSSGSTLFKNNLKRKLFLKVKVLAVSPKSRISKIIDTLKFRIESVLELENQIYFDERSK
jgi:ATP phosphoribosyltransferase